MVFAALLLLGAPCFAGTGLAAPTAAPSPPTTRPLEALMADVRALAKPLPGATSTAILVERPIVLDFQDHMWRIDYRFRHDEVSRPAPTPAFPSLVLDDQRAEHTATLEYRRRLGDVHELGVRLPWVEVDESRPTRIAPAPAFPFFTASEEVLRGSGAGDLELFVARACNRPGLSRRLGLDLKLANARSTMSGASNLPLGTGQTDLALSYGLKQTRGSFAITGSASARFRAEGDAGTFAGGTVRHDPGDELALSIRADRRLERWWTASLTLEGLAGKRDALNGVEQAGSSRQLVSLTPAFAFQTSPVFEVLAGLELPLLAHNLPDAPAFGVALRWRH